MRVLVGTSGWSYDDWVGPFYPRGTPAGGRLAHYAAHFPAAEVNATHYRDPDDLGAAPIASRLLRADLAFVAWKAPRGLTHKRHDDAGLAETAADFAASMEPALRRAACDGVLLQFAESTPPAEARRVTDAVVEAGLRAPLFVEARHPALREGAAEPLHEAARATGGALVAIDHPGAAFERALPGPVAYYRFHGRSALWSAASPGGVHGSNRYDYRYGRTELDTLARRVRETEAETVVVFFNNHPGGNAAVNALEFAPLVEADPPRPRPVARRLDEFG